MNAEPVCYRCGGTARVKDRHEGIAPCPRCHDGARLGEQSITAEELEIDKLRAQLNKAAADHAQLMVERDNARADIDRLRELVIRGEWQGSDPYAIPGCPWCGADHDFDKPGHADDCPAFSAPGVVR